MGKHIVKILTAVCLLLSFQSISLQASHLPEFQQFSTSSDNPVHVRLIHEEESVQPGRPFWVALHMKIEDEWHSYWKNPGDCGMAPTVEWNLPEGFAAEPILWPYPQRFELNSSIGFGYENEVVFLTKIQPPKDLLPNANIPISANLHWLVCNDTTCLPGSSEARATLIVAHEKPLPKRECETQFTEARLKLPKAASKIQAKNTKGQIELHLESEADLPDEPVIAQFFPEENEIVDHNVAAVLKRDDENRNKFVLSLKKTDGKEDSQDQLKGVIVLKTESHDNNIVEAIQVDVPLGKQLTKKDLISFEHPSTRLGSAPLQADSQEHDELNGSVLWALAFAFLGGMILNVMPCVFPVISLKILSFVKMAGQDRKKTFKHGLMYSLGVLLSFWVLTGVMIALKIYGNTLGWGFQLQEPSFVAILSAIIFVFSLSLFGVFELGTGLASWAGQTQVKSSQNTGEESYSASLAAGILATALGTPCTGPFLGPAIGFALKQPPAVSMLIFTLSGLGMAFPYLALTAFPNLLRFMPRPGNWMITFKEIMGFIMLATALWLLSVFGDQTGSASVVFLLNSYLFLAIGCRIFGKWGAATKKKSTRLFGVAATALTFAVGGYFIYASLPAEQASQNNVVVHSPHSDWEQFSPERVAELRSRGRPVIVDFTAKWCLICQSNHLALSVGQVAQKMDELGVARMKADLTKKNEMITRELQKFGRSGVPLYLLYHPDSKRPPKILPQLLTPEIVMEHLDLMEREMEADAKVETSHG